jgi:hypothetical protein
VHVSAANSAEKHCNREHLFKYYYIRCSKCSKKEIIINCSSGEINASFVMKNPCEISEIVTIFIMELLVVDKDLQNFFKTGT